MVRDIPIRMLEELPEFVKTTRVDIAALTLPKAECRSNRGSSYLPWAYMPSGILPMSDLDDVDDDMVVENVHLSDSLMQLSYNIANHKQK